MLNIMLYNLSTLASTASRSSKNFASNRRHNCTEAGVCEYFKQTVFIGSVANKKDQHLRPLTNIYLRRRSNGGYVIDAVCLFVCLCLWV